MSLGSHLTCQPGKSLKIYCGGGVRWGNRGGLDRGPQDTAEVVGTVLNELQNVDVGIPPHLSCFHLSILENLRQEIQGFLSKESG